MAPFCSQFPSVLLSTPRIHAEGVHVAAARVCAETNSSGGREDEQPVTSPAASTAQIEIRFSCENPSVMASPFTPEAAASARSPSVRRDVRLDKVQHAGEVQPLGGEVAHGHATSVPLTSLGALPEMLAPLS